MAWSARLGCLTRAVRDLAARASLWPDENLEWHLGLEFCLDEIGTTRRYCRFDELADRDDDMDVPMSEPDPMTEE